jgi:pimeloyl-ACP methyl ester carboxylesterase
MKAAVLFVFNPLTRGKEESQMIAINEYAEERRIQVVDFIRMLEASRASTTLEICYQPVKIDYRIIRNRKAMSRVPIMLLTGWGSGWEGIAPLAFSLYAEGHDVILLSLPGYGNSDNPPKDFYNCNYYTHVLYAIRQFLDALNVREAHLVGHSMGAGILAKFAVARCEFAKSLILLSPSGAFEYSGWYKKACLMADFTISGIRLRLEDKREHKNLGPRYDYLRPLIDLCGKQKSPFFDWRFKRIRQRWYEFRELTERNLANNLGRVNCRILAILGSLDTVYPVKFVEEEILKAMACRVYVNKTLQIKTLAGMHHNPTLFRPEEVARIISDFIKGIPE